MFATFIAIVAFFGLALLGMGVRMLFIKNSEMRAGCAGKNPMLQEEGVACGICGAKPGDACKEEDNLTYKEVEAADQAS